MFVKFFIPHLMGSKPPLMEVSLYFEDEESITKKDKSMPFLATLRFLMS